MTKTIAIHACRSGIGRSQIASCLGVATAQPGRRVAIVAAGEQQAARDPFRFFGLAPDYPARNLDDGAPWDGAIADVSYLLGLLPAPTETGALWLLRSPAALQADAARLHAVLQQLSQDLCLDYILLLPSPGLQPENFAPLAFSDMVLLALSLDRRDFQDIAVSIDILKQLGVLQTQLVLNAMPATLETERWQEQLELAYAVPVAGVLPWTDEMALLNGQELLYLRYPDLPFSAAIRAIARRLPAARRPPRPTAPPAPTANLSLLDLIDLPEPQRRLLNWAVRRRRISRGEALDLLRDGLAASDSETSEVAVEPLLDQLLARGILVAETEGDRCYYRPAIAPRQRRRAAHLWQALD